MKTNWQTKKLGDIFQIERGGSPRPIEKFLTTDEDGINWIKIGDTKKVTKYIYKTEEKIKPSGLKKTRLVHDGDFILSNSMSFGRPYIMKTTGAIHDGWLVLREKLNGINKDFFYYLLGSPLVFNQFNQLAAGSTVRNLNTKLVSNVEVSFPSLDEQKQVVKKLEKIFKKLMSAKEDAEKNLQNSKELLESYLQSVFAKPNKDWEEKMLGEVCEYEKIPNRNQELPYVGLEDVQSQTGKLIKPPTPKKVKSLTFHFTNEHVLYGRLRPYLNKVLLPDFEGHCSTEIFPIKAKKDILDRGFLFQWLISKETMKKINATWTGATLPRANMNTVLEFKINIPPIKEQKVIVKKLEALSVETKKIEKIYEQKLSNLEELKKSILNKAFVGEL